MISHYKPPATTVQSQTVIVTNGAARQSQVFDLGQIRAAYIEVKLTAFNADTLTIGTSAGNIAVFGATIQASRDGVAYTTLDSNQVNTAYTSVGQTLPRVVTTARGVAPRYISVATEIDDGFSGLGYVGPRNPTATYSMYVEYV